MENLTVALAQYAWQGSPQATQDQVETLIKTAKTDHNADLVCLPEFSLAPYFASHMNDEGFKWAQDPREGDSAQFFSRMAKTYGVKLVGSLYEKTPKGEYFDTAVIYNENGEQIGYTRKIHIPSSSGYYEHHYFKGYHDYPVHDLGAVKLAAPTCYDQWFPELARIYGMNGAEFIFYPTAIGSEPDAPDLDTRDAWQTIMRGNAIANGVYIGAANRIGAEDVVTFYGSSFICDPTGKIIAQAGRDTTEVISAVLDGALFAHWRDFFPLLHQRAPQTYARITEDRIDGLAAPDWLQAQKDKDVTS